MRKQLLILRSPEDDPANPDNPGGGGGGNDPAVDPNKTDGNTPALAQRPDDFPEDLWDAEKGAPKLDAVAGKLKEYATAAEANQGVAKVEDIDWSLPADLDPDTKDAVFEVNQDDPMVQAIAPELVGLPQERISKLVASMARFQIAEAKQFKAAVQAEEKKLGDKFMERITGAQSFVELALTAAGKKDAKELAQRFRNTWVTAEQVEVIEALAKHANGPGVANPDPKTTTPENKGRTFYAGMTNGAQ